MKKILCLISIVFLSCVMLPAHAGLILWQAEHDGQKIWLLGSIHAGRADFYPLPAAIEAAYQQADTVVLETVDSFGDEAAQIGQLWAELALLPPDQSLTVMLNAKQKRLFQQTMSDAAIQKNSGVSAEQFNRMRPWAAWMILSGVVPVIEAGFDPAQGIDQHFYNQAKADGKKLVGLETSRFQLQLFANLTEADAIILLSDALDPKERQQAGKDLLLAIKAWKQGDLRTLRKISDEDSGSGLGKRLNEKLLGERNRGMVEKIEQLAGNPAPLVIVGTAHLLGKDNLLDMLRKRGFIVTQY